MHKPLRHFTLTVSVPPASGIAMAQGLLPPKALRKAALEEFVPAQ